MSDLDFLTAEAAPSPADAGSLFAHARPLGTGYGLHSVYLSLIPEDKRSYVLELLDLFKDSPALGRLADVGMSCGLQFTKLPPYPMNTPYSRLDHSLGVALLVAGFVYRFPEACVMKEASPARPEAIIVAGLLHDIATPVFAHSIDFLNGDYLTQESTEDATYDCIHSDSVIQQALATLSLTEAHVCDYHLYPLADNDSPALSCDRLEYTLGTPYAFGTLSVQEAAELLSHLAFTNGEAVRSGELCSDAAVPAQKQCFDFQKPAPELYFDSREPAETLALFSIRNGSVFASDNDRFAMQYFAELVRQGLTKGILVPSDLMTTETEVLEKLRTDPSLAADLNQLQSLTKITVSKERPASDSPYVFKIPAKRRFINPLYLSATSHSLERVIKNESTDHAGRESETATGAVSRLRLTLESYLEQDQDVYLSI